MDVFFVLSGYLITGLILRELEATGRVNFRAFYARRILRLLPASAFVLVATLLASIVLLSPLEGLAVSQTGQWTAVYASNLYFLRRFVDYFASEGVNPFLHNWSLAVEEQFYLAWPLIILLAWRSARSRTRVGIALCGVTVLSLGTSIWLTQHFQPWAFFSMPTRGWEFGLGGLASMSTARASGLPVNRWARLLGWPGLLLILGAGIALPSGLSFPGVAALVPVLGTIAVLIGGAAAVGTGAARVLAHPVLQWLGRLSYSWYLWHWPVLVLAGALWTPLPLAVGLFGAAISLALAYATQRYLERPIRFHPLLVHRPGRTLALGALLTATCVGLATGSFLFEQRLSRSSAQQAIVASAMDQPVTDQDGCMVTFLVAEPRECTFGPPDAPVTLVLFGDSHASQWFPAVQAAADPEGWRVVTLLKSSCPPARLTIYNPRIGRAENECDAWRDAALQRIQELHPTIAILASAASGYIDRGIGSVDSGYSTYSYGAWSAGERTTLAQLSAVSIPELLLEDTPRPDFDMPICLSRNAWWPMGSAEACALVRVRAIDPGIVQADTDAVQGLPSVQLMDVTSRFCGPAVCEPVVDGQYPYRDSNHMTAAFAASLGPALRSQLKTLVH